MPESKLEIAKRKGDLAAVVGALREEWQAQQSTATAGTPVRGEMDLIDAAVHVSAGMADKPEVERRQALRNVQAGMTLTGANQNHVTGKEQITARRLTRAEKIAQDFEQRQLTTQQALEALHGLVRDVSHGEKQRDETPATHGHLLS